MMTKLQTTNYKLQTPRQSKLLVYFAADHAGYELKEALVEFVHNELGYEVVDMGAHEFDAQDDYPDFVHKAARAVGSSCGTAVGIILGGSGQGEAIVANRYKGVRAVVYYGEPTSVDSTTNYKLQTTNSTQSIIALSREHNNANILSLGARFLSLEEAKEAVRVWLNTDFSGADRHTRRIEKIDALGDLIIFDKWNKIKKETEEVNKRHYYREGDVFFARLGKNIGYEQDGSYEGDFLRPILIVRGFNKDIFFAVALTTSQKEHPFYMSLGEIGGKKSVAILSQARLLDSKRLDYKIGHVSHDVLQRVRQRLSEVLLRSK